MLYPLGGAGVGENLIQLSDVQQVGEANDILYLVLEWG